MSEPARGGVTAAEAAARIGAAFEPLRGAPVRSFGAGWDNVAFEVAGRWVFRFPRREAAEPYLRREIEVLPTLAPQLPVAISAPRFVSHGPPPFAGYPKLPGKSAGAGPIEGRAVAAQLGAFLRALHRARLPRELPPLRAVRGKVDLALAADELRGRLRKLRRDGWALDFEAIEARRRAWSVASPPGARVPVHGDLYPRHLLVEDGGLAGVIDWGDVHQGDPAVDLSLAFGWLGPEDRPAFEATYGAIDAATARRAWFRVLYYGVVLDQVGALLADAELRAIGRAYRARALAEPVEAG